MIPSDTILSRPTILLLQRKLHDIHGFSYKDLQDLSPEELIALWNMAKRQENAS